MAEILKKTRSICATCGEIIPAAYQNEAKRVHIPGLDPRTIPGSPEDIRIPVASDPSAGLPPIPGRLSIARALIDDWLSRTGGMKGE